MNETKSTLDSMYKDVDHTRLEVYEVVQTFFGSCGFKLPLWKIFKGHKWCKLSGFFIWFLLFVFLIFYTKADIFHNKVLKILKRLPIPFGGTVLNCIAQRSLNPSPFSLSPRV